MQGLPVFLAPVSDLAGVGRIGINPDNHLGEERIAIAVSGIVSAYALRRAIQRIEMHCGEHCGQAGTELRVAGNGFIAQLGEVVGTPIPLQAGNEQHVERALRGWKWNGPDVLEKRITQCAYRLNSFLEFFGRAVVAPHDCAHFFEVKMLGKHRRGWHREESEEASYFLWSLLD